MDENFRVLCTNIQNSKQDRGKPGGCAVITDWWMLRNCSESYVS